MALSRAVLGAGPIRRQAHLAQPLAVVASTRSFAGHHDPDVFKKIGSKWWEFKKTMEDKAPWWRFGAEARESYREAATEYWREWDKFHVERRIQLIKEKKIDESGKVLCNPDELCRDDVYYLAPEEVSKHGILMEEPEDGFLTGPFGTVENPVIVPSNENHRIVGCVGGRNGKEEHTLLWFTIRRGPKHRCPCCGQVFQLKTSWKEGMPIVPHPTMMEELPSEVPDPGIDVPTEADYAADPAAADAKFKGDYIEAYGEASYATFLKERKEAGLPPTPTEKEVAKEAEEI